MYSGITIAAFDRWRQQFKIGFKQMFSSLEQRIMKALRGVMNGEEDIVAQNRVSGLVIKNKKDVFFVLEVDAGMDGAGMEDLRLRTLNAAQTVRGVDRVDIVLTAERTAAQGDIAATRPVPDPHGMDKNPKLTLPIRHIIAVASGKGGVGKSTVAFNLAVALSKMGKTVGLLDADIYGPSVPRLSGLSGQKPQMGEDKKLVPLTAYGVKMMSMGFLVEEEKAMIWRGPMIQTAFYQMLRDVAWGSEGAPLDVLVIDMPPGTGDVQLTLAQKVPVTGAVIVSTPQDLALMDARKAIAMFEKTDVKILGLIENMSSYCCPNCGHVEPVFGHGGAHREAQIRGVPFLGEIPLNAKIREESDNGVPVSEGYYEAIAREILSSL